MKTTLDLPEPLVRAVKIRAVREGKKLKDLVAILLHQGMSNPRTAVRSPPRRRNRLPVISCAHAAKSGQEMTPDRVAGVLLEQDVAWHRDAR
jgi:hypothetical protein